MHNKHRSSLLNYLSIAYLPDQHSKSFFLNDEYTFRFLHFLITGLCDSWVGIISRLTPLPEDIL